MAELIEVTVGVIGRAHGVRGDVSIEVRTDEPERRFAAGAVLRDGTGRRFTVARAKLVSGRLVVSFTEVTDRNLAEELRGTELLADVAADEMPSGDDEFFDRQLVGLVVLDAAGRRAGTITEVLHPGAQDLLVIDVDGSERLVPFVEALVPVVDLAAGHVQLADVGGLLSDEDA